MRKRPTDSSWAFEVSAEPDTPGIIINPINFPIDLDTDKPEFLTAGERQIAMYGLDPDGNKWASPNYYRPIKDTSTQARSGVLYNRCNEKKGTTMATIVKKSELKYEGGYLSHNGAIITPGFVERYQELEKFLQVAAFTNETNKVEQPRFKPQSIVPDKMIEVPDCATPVMDKEAKKADALGKENQAIRAKEEVERILDNYNSVVEFVVSDTVVLQDHDYHTTLIDTPVLGDPLKLTKTKLLKLVCDAVEYELPVE